jgi:hypothetical protein
MGAQFSTEQDHGDPERAPLLPERRDPESPAPPASRAKRTAKWFARNAVPLCIVLLFTAVIVILCGFLIS